MKPDGIERWRRYHNLLRDNGANEAMSLQACAISAGTHRNRSALYKALGWLRVTGPRTWEFTGPHDLDQDAIEDMQRADRLKRIAGKVQPRRNDPDGPINFTRAPRKVIFSSYQMARRFASFLVEKGIVVPVMEKGKEYYAFRFGGGEPLRYTNSKTVFGAWSATWLTTEETDYLVDARCCVPLTHAKLYGAKKNTSE